MILNHIVLKIQRYEQNHKSICSDNIHYRITYFFSKSNINPKSCRIFNGWVLKQITNQRISLKKAILKQDELSGNFTKCIVYCKNMQFKEKCNIWYTVNTFYDDYEYGKSSLFYSDYIAGTNFIIFTINSDQSFEEFKIFWMTIPDNIQKTLLVYNIEICSNLKNKEIKAIIDMYISRDKFITAKVIKIHLPKNEADTKEAIIDQKYYLPHKFVTDSHVLLNHEDVCYIKATNAIRHDTLFWYMSRIILEEDYSLAKELEENKQNIDFESLYKLEQLLKSEELKDIDYKIATLNRILEIINRNLKEGVKLCSLMDGKYYWNFSNVIKRWNAHIPCVNELIQKKELFDIKYFGKSPPNSSMTISNSKLINRYYKKYFKKLANQLIDFTEPTQWLDEIQIKVSNYWQQITKNEQSVPFFIITRLVEAVIKNKNISWIFQQQDSSFENLAKLVTEFDPSLVIKTAESKGMFDVLSRCEKWREDFKYYYSTPLEYGPNKLRRRELKGIQEAQRKEAEVKRLNEEMLKRSESIRIEQAKKLSNKRMHDEQDIDEIDVDLSEIPSDSDEEPQPDENTEKSIKDDIDEIYMYIGKYKSSYS